MYHIYGQFDIVEAQSSSSAAACYCRLISLFSNELMNCVVGKCAAFTKWLISFCFNRTSSLS